MEEDWPVVFIKSQREGPTVQSTQASHSHHPGLLKHLYPLTQGYRKFSSKPLLLEALEVVSQSGADENHSQRIVAEECSNRLVSSKEPSLGHPHGSDKVQESSRNRNHQHRVWHTEKDSGK